PALSADGGRLYFVSDMPGGYGGTDIYVVGRQGEGWGEPENLGPMINTEQNESFPFIAADGTLYFSSNGHPGMGGLDIYAAMPARTGGFSSPINVGAPVNGPSDDFAFIIDPTGSRGYFSSSRPDGMGSDDLYAFVMTAPLEQRFICSGLVIDDEHDIPVIAADVFLYDARDNLVATASTDGRGEFTFPVEKDREYRLVARMPGRFDGEQAFSTTGIELEQIITRDIHLVADVGIWMRGNVRPSEGPGFLAGATVSVVNLSSFHTEAKTTGPGGDFGFRLQTNEEFEVLIEKPGYFSQSIPVSTLGMKQGILDMNELRDLVMEPIEPGRPIALKHVRWEDRKATLDPIARTELDALAERLLVNRGLLVEIAVHSDARGKAQEEQRLTQKRAEAIVDHLASRRVPRERLTAKGYGSSRLLNHCAAGVSCTEEEHAVNRRNEYVVTGILE
ncbi:MAG: OmpA family protein, partial [Flavobacteriales bacterium]|nr:OmpA family protein [Flavobacteriales bacterium]